jgi:hypothetical protein
MKNVERIVSGMNREIVGDEDRGNFPWKDDILPIDPLLQLWLTVSKSQRPDVILPPVTKFVPNVVVAERKVAASVVLGRTLEIISCLSSGSPPAAPRFSSALQM